MSETEDPRPLWSDEELKSKVGQLFIVGFKGHVPSEDIKTLITTHKVGAVILFSRNIENATQLVELTNSLHEISRSAGQTQGLFISIDQENGIITRIKPPVATQLPGAMALGATKDPSNAYKIATATAETLKVFGVNMNYAPIADVNSEPKNPVIGVRSFSYDPSTVSKFVSAQFKGLQDGGVVPCVKHFPGHGDTAVDSHFGLPVISKSRAQVDACELIPFREAVVEGVDAVMTAHIVMSGLEKSQTDSDKSSKGGLPASLNPDIINILRKEMQYDGLVVSDCLEMEGVRGPYGTERAAVMALKAGTDCVMICHTIASQIGAIQQVINAVKSGELSQAATQKSVDRVEALKTKYSVSNTAPINFTGTESRNEKQLALASEIYSKSTTVVRSEPEAFPIRADAARKIVFLRPGKGPKPGGCVEESDKENVRDQYTPAAYIDVIRSHDLNAVEIQYHEETPFSEESHKLIAEADYVILATINASLSGYQKAIGLSLGKKLGNKLVVIATSDPYDFLEDTEDIRNYVAIYETTIAAFKSAMDVVFGKVIATGSLPVANPGVKHHIESSKGQ
ncbi:hypothetical protein HYALB_00007011 [Hymenoscyphus albidus]|uniref:Glycoside hydrolase family 3 N-terminal domain-containing protein n=1 Tax=Hymenoscyphus albidus TaxID=595503 RepID=A0A9N9LRK9_9HELO|nr:hypothetical protein HYALB_00007011 [Hymenoscyphus albidus]